MAHILDVELPETPTGGPPRVQGGDYQHIETSPNMFGGFGAQAARAFGQGVQTAADTGLSIATQQAERQNDLYNVELRSWYADQLSNMHAKFMNLEGKAANDARPQYNQQAQDLRKQALDQVKSPAAAAKLAPSLASLQDQYFRYWSGHAGTQLNTYDKTVTGNAIASNAAVASNALMAGDEVGFARAMNNQDNEVRNYYSGQHYEPAQIEQEVSKRRGATLSTIIETTADSGNVGKANELFDRFKGKMDAASIQKVTAKLKVVNNDTKAIGIVDQETQKNTSSPFDIAQRMVGTSAVGNHDALTSFLHNIGGQNIDPATTPWCAAWANSVLRAAGYGGTGSAAARSFLGYGTPVNDPQQGDVVVLSRGADPSKGHVGFYAGPGDTPGTIKILGGNQGGQVSVAEFPADRVLGYRRLSQSDVAGKMPPIGPGPSSFSTINKGDVLDRILSRDDLRENPLLRNAVVQEVNRRFTIQQATYADQEHAWQLKQHQQQDAFKQGMDELQAGLLANDPTWTSERILSDPRFAYNREHALEVAQRPVTGEPNKRTSAMLRRSLEERIGLPAGDPNKIQSEQQVYGDFKNLTTSDYDAVIKHVRDLRTEGGQRLAERKKEFLDGIKPHFNDPLGVLTGDEGQKFDLFRNDLERKIAQYKQENKDPFDLMDPSKPDYVGSTDNVQSYKGNLQEQLARRAQNVWTQGGNAVPFTAAEQPESHPAVTTAPSLPPEQMRRQGETLAQWLNRTGRNPFAAPEQPQVPQSR